MAICIVGVVVVVVMERLIGFVAHDRKERRETQNVSMAPMRVLVSLELLTEGTETGRIRRTTCEERATSWAEEERMYQGTPWKSETMKH